MKVHCSFVASTKVVSNQYLVHKLELIQISLLTLIKGAFTGYLQYLAILQTGWISAISSEPNALKGGVSLCTETSMRLGHWMGSLWSACILTYKVIQNNTLSYKNALTHLSHAVISLLQYTKSVKLVCGFFHLGLRFFNQGTIL
jgi:hypothetical protein